MAARPGVWNGALVTSLFLVITTEDQSCTMND
jgi:hypothetical protein